MSLLCLLREAGPQHSTKNCHEHSEYLVRLFKVHIWLSAGRERKETCLLTSFVVMALNGAAKFNKICPIIISAIERMLVPDDNAVTPRQWQYLFQDVYALTHARPKSFSEELHTSLSEFVASHFHKQCQVAFAMFDSTTISNAQLHIRL